MNRITQIRLAVAMVAIVVWGYGYSVQDQRITLAGIVLLAIALFMRWLGPRPSRRGGDPDAR